MSSRFYISGALTGVPEANELKNFYEAIEKVCIKLGHTAYLPHYHSDPILHRGLSAKEVYEIDQHQISRSDYVIAYVDMPSLGVGTEIEMAKEFQIPVILLYKEGTHVSRMVRGNPFVIREIVFSDFSSAIIDVENFLINYLKQS